MQCWGGRTCLALLLLLVVPAVAFAARSDRIEHARVCGEGAIDRGAGECKRDQSGSPIVSPTFICSAGVRGEPNERFAGRFFYKGSAFPAFGAKTTDNRRGINIYITAGPQAMPGGLWGCELRVGPELVKKSFRSAGPTGPILYVAVCASSRTVAAGSAQVCRRDERGSSFSPTESVTCSAVLVGGKGRLAGFEFLHEGKDVGLGQDFEIPLPITAAGPQLDPDPKLTSGRWTCRWTLAGRVLAAKTFRIA
jgi:hypothetical protein